MGELDPGTKEDEGSKKAELPGKTGTTPGSLRVVLKNSDRKDMLLMALGTVGCVADGLTLSLMMIVLSNLMNGYASASLGPGDVNKYALDLFYVAIAVGSGSFLEGFCWARTTERQVFRRRQQYLQAVLRQDVGFFDQTRGEPMTSQVVSRISVDTLTIQGVLNEKIANFIANITMFISAQLAALYLCWRLAIVAIPALLVMIIPGLVYGKLLVGVGEKIQEASAVSGRIVEQALSFIRTVYSYVGEKWTAKSYKISLEPVLKLGIKQGLIKGMAIGSIGISYAVWALQGWYGSILVTDKGFKGGSVFIAGVCITNGGLALGGALINFKYFSEANIAASRIFEMIECVPSIDLVGEEGMTLSDVSGEVEFKDLYFAYPSRPESLVLKKFSLRVMASQTVGFMGRSGSGKSTIINLLERIYDPVKGDILLDGANIRTLQLKWLRSQMGLVSQEPILFATTIKENILLGKEGATTEEIIKAATAANAHNFITQLPNGYDTQVGQLGIQMSEGQKQRISIARALLRDPRILLLDEATSALDSHSEKAVQDALSVASIGRTTFVVAHRLSALSNAHLIAVIQSGEVVESGSHEKLMENEHGVYSTMVQLQRTSGGDGIAPSSQVVDFKKPASIRRKTTLLDELNTDPLIRSPQSKQNTGPEDHGQSPPFWSLVSLTVPEWKSTVLGCLGVIFYGFVQPVHSFCLGALLSVYVIEDHHKIRSQTRIYCFTFSALAIFAFVTNVIQHYFLGVMGENLTKRLREALFDKILTFEIEWFDQEGKNSGAL
ncbi:putative multidrug resistance protein [Rhodamnia argentea]|uniref:Multidrug resistance protein n=1 Tax=Rhodamnia argentea TaxID=178133 RepID=A0A8B8QCZ0_9MYRT|nr:putative multidrug resistance protein [Rhodamnia argentea]